MKYFSLDELVDMIPEPNRSHSYRLLHDNKSLFAQARGGKSKHQAWKGGYLDHLTETMNIAVRLYDTLDSLRPLPFPLSDPLLVLSLHDLDKPWRYTYQNHQWEEVPEMSTKELRDAFAARKIAEYNFQLTPEHQNALKYVEGEGNDYHAYERKQGHLAAFCHLCDTTSARIWDNEPKVKGKW